MSAPRLDRGCVRVALLALALLACAGGPIRGYLDDQELPDGVALLPPPPAAGSPELAQDQQLADAALALRGTPRWDLATTDANLGFPQAAGIYSCALGARLGYSETPNLVILLRRSLEDAARSVQAPKAHWARPRPFVENGQPTCTPEPAATLGANSSYPSGHSTAGWVWALVLAELAPDRAAAVEARGRAVGESRVVCNVHWYSDVVQGRALAAAIVDRLHENAAFELDLEAARAEVAAVRARGLPPTRDCAREAAQLSQGLPTPAESPGASRR